MAGRLWTEVLARGRPVDGGLSSGMADRHAPPGVEVGSTDLDAPPRAAPPRAAAPTVRRATARSRSRRRTVGVAAAVAVVAVALVLVQHARGGAEAGGAGLVAVAGGLEALTRPTSADNNTRAVLRVELRNDAEDPVTLLALRPTGDPGSLMRDDLRSSGAESMGVQSGATLRPGRRVAVRVSGVVRCAGAGAAPTVTGDLGARVRGLDGVERDLVVPGPTARSWTTALQRACAAGPAR